MTIEFNCPNCSKLLRTRDDKAGARAKCPDCGSPVQVPAGGGPPAEEDFGYEEQFDYGEEDYEDYGEDFAAAAPPPRTGKMKPCPMCGEQIKADAVKCRYCGEDLGGAAPRRGRRVEYAGFWMRFAAFFIDGLIMGAVNFAIAFVFGLIMGLMIAGGGGRGAEGAMVILQLVVNVLSIVIQWLYFALMECSSNQGTFGKMALGIKVTDMNGRRLTFGKATGRHFGKILSGLICLVGYFMAGFTEKKQALHDMLAGCLVVRK